MSLRQERVYAASRRRRNAALARGTPFRNLCAARALTLWRWNRHRAASTSPACRLLCDAPVLGDRAAGTARAR